jgi:hypothetical protein
MSPTVLRQEGYTIAVYANDHSPPHVHVKRAENDARIRLDPIEVLHTEGFNERELGKILSIVRENHGLLLEAWNKLHPTER